MSRDEIERDVTQQIESLARAGQRPPPAEWTLTDGLPEAEPRPAMVIEELNDDTPKARPASKKKKATTRRSA